MAALDWPLSREEKKGHVLRLYDQDLRLASALLRAGGEELDALRREKDAVKGAAAGFGLKLDGGVKASDGLVNKERSRLSDASTATTSSAVTADGGPCSARGTSQFMSAEEAAEQLERAVETAAAVLSASPRLRFEGARRTSSAVAAFAADTSRCQRRSVDLLAECTLRAADTSRRQRRSEDLLAECALRRVQRGRYTPRFRRANASMASADGASAPSPRRRLAGVRESLNSDGSACEADCEAPATPGSATPRRWFRRRYGSRNSAVGNGAPSRVYASASPRVAWHARQQPPPASWGAPPLGSGGRGQQRGGFADGAVGAARGRSAEAPVASVEDFLDSEIFSSPTATLVASRAGLPIAAAGTTAGSRFVASSAPPRLAPVGCLRDVCMAAAAEEAAATANACGSGDGVSRLMSLEEFIGF